MSAALEFGFRAEPGEAYCSGGIPGYVRATNVTQEGRDPRGERKVWMITVALFQDANETPNVQVQAGVAAFFPPPLLKDLATPRLGLMQFLFWTYWRQNSSSLVTFSIWLLFLLEIVLCLASCSLVPLSMSPMSDFSFLFICIFLLLENDSGSFAIHNLKLSLCWIWEERLAGSR